LAAEDLLHEWLAREERVIGIELASRPYQPSLVSVLKNNQRHAGYHQQDGQPQQTGEGGPAENEH
jgi:hypothetical protein